MQPRPAPSRPANLAESLRAAQPWLRLVGILCWVAAGFLLAATLLLLNEYRMGAAGHDPESDAVIDALASLAYVALALLHVYPAILLLRAARLIRGLRDDAAGVAGALEAQRRLWKYLGTCLIVALSAGLLLVIALVLIAVTQAANP